MQNSDALTLADLSADAAQVCERERQLRDVALPAEDMYTGEQHLRLMRGVRALRRSSGDEGTAIQLDLWILSAGFGLVPANRMLPPYECSFTDMRMNELRAWSRHLGVPVELRNILAEPFHLGLVLLGKKYLAACELDDRIVLGGPTLILTGQKAAAKLPELPDLRIVRLATDDTRRFKCGQVGLKGEVVARLLEKISANPTFLQQCVDPTTDLLGQLSDSDQMTTVRSPSSRVSRVISIQDDWLSESRARSLRYFIPDWDDQVDPDYDFANDEHSDGSSRWDNEVYSHEIFPTPNYDGILVSRAVIEKGSARKRDLIGNLGVHDFLRVPRAFTVIGDCGAFGYVREPAPPYSTNEIIDYYTNLGFDLGVSVDHLIFTEVDDERKYRYELTINNAAEFLREHRARGLHWRPVGAVQGWSPESYRDAARQLVELGYDYIALGGLARSRTTDILDILRSVRDGIPSNVSIHLFGVARLEATLAFQALGVQSFDSASPLRRAWLDARKNYLTPDGWYASIRIPYLRGQRAQQIVRDGLMSEAHLSRLEQDCLSGIRSFAQHSHGPSNELLDMLMSYDALLRGSSTDTYGSRERIGRLLADRPWERCGCAVCQRRGVEVVVFRGNNRNRRRGFHNTYVFYQLLGRLLNDEKIPWIQQVDAGTNSTRQLELALTESN